MSVTEQVASEAPAGGRFGRALAGLAPGTVRPSIYGRHHFRALAVATVLVACVPLFVHGLYGYDVATRCGLYALLSLGFYYQFALSGQFSFATAAFYALGAYTSAWVGGHSTFFVGFVAALVVTAVIAGILKLALARSPLIQFGIATLSATALALIVFRNWTEFTGGTSGKFGLKSLSLLGYNFDTPTKQFYLVAATGLIGVLVLILFERSPARRDLVFTRDMGMVARTAGLRTNWMFITAFAIGGAYMAAAGSLFAHGNSFVTLESFDVAISLDVLLMVLLGGTGSVWGPPLGAIALVLLPEKLRSIADYKELVYAAVILLVVLVLPGGLASIPSRVRELVAKRRGSPS